MQQVKYSINKEEEEDEEMNQSMYLIVDDHTYTTYIRISFQIILLNGRRLHLDRTHTHMPLTEPTTNKVNQNRDVVHLKPIKFYQCK